MVALYFATDPGPRGSEPSDGMVTAFAIPQELEKYYDSDSVSCIANLANMTAEEKVAIHRLTESLNADTGDISDAGNIERFNTDGVVHRLMQFIRAEKPYFQPIMNPMDLFVPYFVHPKLSNRRILAQSGAFILYGIHPPEWLFRPHQIEDTPFIVPQGDKRRIREALDNIGINESALFPEIDKAADQIRKFYVR